MVCSAYELFYHGYSCIVAYHIHVLYFSNMFEQVETIDDAYMVVCGVPDQVVSHPDRIANTALGMRIAACDVLSPFDYGDKSTSVKVNLKVYLPVKVIRCLR